LYGSKEALYSDGLGLHYFCSSIIFSRLLPRHWLVIVARVKHRARNFFAYIGGSFSSFDPGDPLVFASSLQGLDLSVVWGQGKSLNGHLHGTYTEPSPLKLSRLEKSKLEPTSTAIWRVKQLLSIT